MDYQNKKQDDVNYLDIQFNNILKKYDHKFNKIKHFEEQSINKVLLRRLKWYGEQTDNLSSKDLDEEFWKIVYNTTKK